MAKPGVGDRPGLIMTILMTISMTILMTIMTNFSRRADFTLVTFEGVGSCIELLPPRTDALVAQMLMLMLLLLLRRTDQFEPSRTGHHTDPVDC